MSKSHFSLKETNLGEPIPSPGVELYIPEEDQETLLSKAKRKVMVIDAQMLGIVIAILQIIAMLGGGFYFLWRMDTRMQVLTTIQDSMSRRLDAFETEIKALAKVTISIAQQEVRMDNTDARVNELSKRIEGMTHIYEFGFSGNKLQRTKKSVIKDE